MTAAPAPDTTTTVVPYPDGPLILRGDFELCTVDGTPIEHHGSAVALCRCGRSAAKPFCDGSHKISGPDRSRWRRTPAADEPAASAPNGPGS
jgi:CDGSH-type Zn-finger protein